MSAKDFDPRRLDVAAFAKAAGELAGRWPLVELDRLTDMTVAETASDAERRVTWEARGEARAMRAGAAQVWLHASAETRVRLQCQRCLQPFEVPLAVQRSFMFVHGEDAAAQLDADSEDDVLALTRALDLRELIEDELLLALPIVPRHDVCPQPLQLPVDILEDAAEEPHPFAGLAQLKGTKPPGPLN
ncbi:MAG: DUF177 domain-containing protein [Pseudomonadota bacterium]|nr:DUF177 domain-containing protein [Pseudomonadota bacterium]